MADFDLCAGHEGGLGLVAYEDALARVLAYVGEAGTGWATYDLPAIHARRAGQFQAVGPWSILFANALSGRVDQKDVAGFTLSRRTDFADRVSRVPDHVPLADLSNEQVAAVVDLASFGFKGVWGPKITKLAALYRPDAVPVLDGQMARAFGLGEDAFRRAGQWKVHIEAVIREIAAWHRVGENRELLSQLRAEASNFAVEITMLSDVRLLDIIVWTTQDDRFSRRTTKTKAWVDIKPSGAGPTLASAEAVPIPGHAGLGLPGV